MLFLSILIFALFQACYPTEMFNASDPETKDYWMQFLLRGKGEKITSIETELETTAQEPFSESLNLLNLEWTLLIGAPEARTYGEGIAIDNENFVYVTGNTNKGVYRAEPIGNRDLILGKYDSKKIRSGPNKSERQKQTWTLKTSQSIPTATRTSSEIRRIVSQVRFRENKIYS